ncbi:MAG: sulfatase-like hydrolase/transferase [Sphingomonadales bacterium]
MNFLLITLDQFRGDCLGAAGHPLVRTPHLDRLAAAGVRFARHYSNAAPCGPGRACLYTGMYQMNNRVVANGTPLDARFDNVALAARRAGLDPTLFGYTDQSVDPRQTAGPDDPRLESYEGVLPGFALGEFSRPGHPTAWLEFLRAQGHEVSDDWREAAASEPQRPAQHSISAWLTDRFLDWLPQQHGPWFAHLSHIRPHEPFAAAGEFARAYDPAACPPPIAPAADCHPFHQRLQQVDGLAAPRDPAAMADIQAQYYGMISEVDAQLGRVWDWLEANGQWDETFIIVTSDHGENLGDHGLIQKCAWFEASYHVPAIIRDPRRPAGHGRQVDAFTEAVDILPTLAEAMGIPVPLQCDGLPLTPFLDGGDPPFWRQAAHWEWDWRYTHIPAGPHAWPWDRRLEDKTLLVHRDETIGYVQFGNGSAVAFDLAADPSWRTRLTDPVRLLAAAQALLGWRACHADRTLTGLLIEAGGIGRWPPMPANWGVTDAA